MKICYLANSAIPSSNASSIQIVKMCEGFSKLNHKVLLITTNVSDKKVFDFYNVRSKFQIKKLKVSLAESCFKTFKSNSFLGFLIFINLIIGKVFVWITQQY